ncbi:hypothetical protein KUCAC02_037240 [Chaenocephalus aceratus]|nr:hypothetical protein KUCAC02_037240 [Chaenocephalus aceratus]
MPLRGEKPSFVLKRTLESETGDTSPFVLETADQQYASSVAENLKHLFPAEIQSGLLEVVSPSVHFYPDFSKLRESFGDPKERRHEYLKQQLTWSCRQKASSVLTLLSRVRGRGSPAALTPEALLLPERDGNMNSDTVLLWTCRWRTKQNLDYCYLMMYAQAKGTYYVQLEDDIVARPNFFTTMKNFALQQPSEEWMILEFSQLGFIV